MPWGEVYLRQFDGRCIKRLAFSYGNRLGDFSAIMEHLGCVKVAHGDSAYEISYPDFTVRHLDEKAGFYPLEEMIYAKILTIRFLIGGHASKGSGKFRTYREMPWGEVYLRQFDGRCIKRLAFSYGNRLGDFSAIMEHLGCAKVAHGDSAYEIEIYPDYRIQMILWEGDDEFPPSAQILFSDNFPVSFQAEDMAVMGDVIIGAMKSYLKYLSTK
jgi:hypothetical protein